MVVQRLVGVSVVLGLATACVPAVSQNAIAPKRGPKASIYASYGGGLTGRHLQARFKVEKDAYALVGHLGGDGVIRVLYPKSPKDVGLVEGGEAYRTSNTFAIYDALPELYLARHIPYRHVSARLDSYDGRGHGYLFVITSVYPLKFDEISDGIEFDDLEVPDYYEVSDPRLTVRTLSDLVSGGSPYTLQFASSFGSMNYSSGFDALSDCLLLSTRNFALSQLSSAYGAGWSFFDNPFGYSFGNRGCGGSRYAFGSFDSPRYFYTYAPANGTVIPRDPAKAKPGTLLPPGRRGIDPRRRRSPSAMQPTSVARRAGTSPRTTAAGTKAMPRQDEVGSRSRRTYSPRSRAGGETSGGRSSSRPSVSESSRPSDRSQRAEPSRPVERAEPAQRAQPVERAQPAARSRPQPKDPE